MGATKNNLGFWLSLPPCLRQALYSSLPGPGSLARELLGHFRSPSPTLLLKQWGTEVCCYVWDIASEHPNSGHHFTRQVLCHLTSPRLSDHWPPPKNSILSKPTRGFRRYGSLPKGRQSVVQEGLPHPREVMKIPQGVLEGVEGCL